MKYGLLLHGVSELCWWLMSLLWERIKKECKRLLYWGGTKKYGTTLVNLTWPLQAHLKTTLADTLPMLLKELAKSKSCKPWLEDLLHPEDFKISLAITRGWSCMTNPTLQPGKATLTTSSGRTICIHLSGLYNWTNIVWLESSLPSKGISYIYKLYKLRNCDTENEKTPAYIDCYSSKY